MHQMIFYSLIVTYILIIVNRWVSYFVDIVLLGKWIKLLELELLKANFRVHWKRQIVNVKTEILFVDSMYNSYNAKTN